VTKHGLEQENMQSGGQSIQNSPSQDYDNGLILGPQLRILQIIVEGISKAKSEFLSKILKEEEIDVAVLQETHTVDDTQLHDRGFISGFTLAGRVNDEKYGIATYVRTQLVAEHLENNSGSSVFTSTVKLGSLTITNLYKPPAVIWPDPPTQPYAGPWITFGDFNSHHTTWGYNQSDPNGRKLKDWADMNKLALIRDAKQQGTFRSARWNQDYNPDLCFCTSDLEDKVKVEKLRNFPHSQHRCIIYSVGSMIPTVNSRPIARWNLRKADWETYSSVLDSTVKWIPPHPAQYDRFVGAVMTAARRSIPRGYRKNYIPGWNEECSALYEEYRINGSTETASRLTSALDKARRDRWVETMENLNFTHSSRKAWSLLRKLGSAARPPCPPSNISPDKIASRLVALTKPQMKRADYRDVDRELKSRLTELRGRDSPHGAPITVEEICKAIKAVNPSKAPGLDGVLPEFLLHCGPGVVAWLARLFTNILTSGQLPPLFKRAKIVAVCKPGKDPSMETSYRPISLLSVVYKMFERVLLNRISPMIHSVVPITQAGFMPGRSCEDQAMALTAAIEETFDKKKKGIAAFVDLSAAYDTIWRKGLLLKLAKAVPCITTVRLINNMLCDRFIKVHVNNKESGWRRVSDGLPQGSVLAPLLFNLYIADMPQTNSLAFVYADDIALLSRGRTFNEAEDEIGRDLQALGTFFQKWRLQPNPHKTVVTTFHLSNRDASYRPEIVFQGHRLAYEEFPKYLGITLDRTLSFRRHLELAAQKLKTRNNILQKLTSTKWGAPTNVLRTSALALVYAPGEYGCSVWGRSRYTTKMDAQLRHTMRIISGTIRSTPVDWLPALSNIAPPHIRRMGALSKTWSRLKNNLHLPIHREILTYTDRLRSRKPPWRLAQDLERTGFSVDRAWTEDWETALPDALFKPPDPTIRPAGFELPRALWCRLNRMITGHGRCGALLYRWGWISSPSCDCGAEHQSMDHIVNDCLRAFTGDGYKDLFYVTDEARKWLRDLDLDI
jgi:hypothetical protein